MHRADGEPMALAGLWAVWRDPATAAQLYSCTIVTTWPNEMMSRLHHRMPVILEPDDWEAWLDPSASVDHVRPMLSPAPDGVLTAYPVSARVNDVRNDGPDLIAPLSPA